MSRYRSSIVRLVRYCNIFGAFDWLPESEAQAKLARERQLYERWSRHPHLRRRVKQPFIIGKEEA